MTVQIEIDNDKIEIKGSPDMVNSMACMLYAAIDRYNNLGLHSLVREPKIISDKIYSELKNIGYYE